MKTEDIILDNIHSLELALDCGKLTNIESINLFSEIIMETTSETDINFVYSDYDKNSETIRNIKNLMAKEQESKVKVNKLRVFLTMRFFGFKVDLDDVKEALQN